MHCNADKYWEYRKSSTRGYWLNFDVPTISQNQKWKEFVATTCIKENWQSNLTVNGIFDRQPRILCFFLLVQWSYLVILHFWGSFFYFFSNRRLFCCLVVTFAIFGQSRLIEIKTFPRFVIKLHAKLSSETICRDVKYSNLVISVTLSQLHHTFVWLMAATRFYLWYLYV